MLLKTNKNCQFPCKEINSISTISVKAKAKEAKYWHSPKLQIEFILNSLLLDIVKLKNFFFHFVTNKVRP